MECVTPEGRKVFVPNLFQLMKSTAVSDTPWTPTRIETGAFVPHFTPQKKDKNNGYLIAPL